MLIIEGPDMVGKTTLIKVLQQRLTTLGYPVIPQHFGLLDDRWDFYGDYLKYVHATTIMDRFILSEVVYGLTLRNKSRISPEVYRLLDAHLRLNGSVTVVIRAEEDWFRDWLDRKFDESREVFDKSGIININSAFHDVLTPLATSKFSKYAFDVDIVYVITNDDLMPSNCENFIDRIVTLYLQRTELLRNARESVLKSL